jgi:alkanesulfonate monooxygenase SsuD/methylene tetrahydromethanopterin reductase-like flavin-dependent oxidoreductase (luciferase family)
MKSILLLTENWTLFPARDLQSLVKAAKIAEEAGIDGVQVSEHIVLGPAANAGEPKRNFREYDAPGNQPPDTPWPSSLLVLSAIAATTTRLNLFAGAILPVLRHPLQVAKDLATLDLLSKGRFVANPTVSWHEQEYLALGKDFHKRGKMLDEHFEIWKKVWSESPASYSGEFYKFDNVYVDPKPWTPGGPRLWITGAHLHPAALRRIPKYGSGYAPGGPMAPGEKEQIYAALIAAGRDPKDFDIMGGIMGMFKGADDVADLDETCEQQLPFAIESGATWVIAKPSQFISRAEEFPDFCRRYVKHIKALG